MLRKGKIDTQVREGEKSWFEVAGRIYAPLFDGDTVAAQRMAFELAANNTGVKRLTGGIRLRFAMPRDIKNPQRAYMPSGFGGVQPTQSIQAKGVKPGGQSSQTSQNTQAQRSLATQPQSRKLAREQMTMAKYANLPKPIAAKPTGKPARNFLRAEFEEDYRAPNLTRKRGRVSLTGGADLGEAIYRATTKPKLPIPQVGRAYEPGKG